MYGRDFEEKENYFLISFVFLLWFKGEDKILF